MNPGQGKVGTRLVVISMDGLSVHELGALGSLPRFAPFLAGAAGPVVLRSVYPSITYVVHATMMTGRWPEGHGIDHNHPLQPGLPEERQRWYWYAREVKAPTLFDLAKKAGLRSAAILWPLVSKAPITWNLPEILALPGESQVLKTLGAGSPAFLLELELLFGRRRRGSEEPALSDFVSLSAAHTIRTRRPHLLMTHLIALDAAKHAAGSDSILARNALEALDRGLGRILDAIESAGLSGETRVVILGDHGHIDTRRRVRLNRLLEKAGLITRGSGWEAWFRCSGGSAYLHVRGSDAARSGKAREALISASADPELGMARIHEGNALEALRSGSGALLAVDAQPGTAFVEDSEGPLREDAPLPGAFGAEHGYHPDQPDYRSLLFASGPGLRKGGGAGAAEMVDVAPTLARMLGLDLENTDGIVMDNLFEDA